MELPDASLRPALPSDPSAASAWHTFTPSEALARTSTDLARGLSAETARQRLAQVGPNCLYAERHETILAELLEELTEPMVLLLLVTGVLYALWGKPIDALTIFGVILALAAVELANEMRAKKAIAALRSLAEPTISVWRGGQAEEIPTEQLVPGDIILLRAGQRVSADARLLAAYGLSADESTLTGEAAPVEKEAEVILPAATPMAERRNLVYAGSMIRRGRGRALVVATGLRTELGRVAGLVRQAKPPRTPLQIAMGQLSRGLVGLALAFSVIVPTLGVLLAHEPLQQMLLTGLSLAFATIPEEMPIIITMVLALGAFRLSKQHAIAKQLRAVETLGAVTVIATDKTGTLTENRMVLSQVYPPQMRSRLLELGVLCNDAVEDGSDGTAIAARGDPLDVALLRAAQEAGLDLAALCQAYLLQDEFTFDNARKRMAVVYSRGEALAVAVKGAPEAVLAQCEMAITSSPAPLQPGEARGVSPESVLEGVDALREPLSVSYHQHLLAEAARMAGAGLRVIALAEKSAPGGRLSQEEAESGLTFVGLAGFVDPPRAGVRQAVADCRSAGIRIVMVTGDHPLTASTIAAQVGLQGDGVVLTGPELDKLSDVALRETVGSVSLYARTTPEHKLRIVQALRARGERVAVTGDGINDAPALAAADIGVAMGETGTDVAREAADLVLADDNFGTIVRAVREGRIVFDNLRKGVRYYLACKVALISVTLLPVLLRVPVPFAPVQIILMELFMDLAASATFVAEPPEADLLHRPPRNPAERFLNWSMVVSIIVPGLGLFAAVSVAYLYTWYRHGNLANAQTVAFVTWLLGHVLLALNLRSEREPLVRLGPLSNPLMIVWGLATVAFVLLATRVPGVREALRTVPLGGKQWLLAILAAWAGTFWLEGVKLILSRPRK